MSLLSLTTFSWLIVTAMISFSFPGKWQRYGIACSSVLFLLWFSPLSFIILSCSAVLVYYCIKVTRFRTAVILVVTGAICTVFGWFKVRHTGGLFAQGTDYILPLGISYYSCRQIHYLVESYKQKLPAHTLLDYLCYLFFLPTLIVGPIHRFPDFQRDSQRRRRDWNKLSKGLERILYGYAKIVIVGNYLLCFKLDFILTTYVERNFLLYEYLKAVSQWMNLYFQFSGYSDVAIGFSLIMGFHVMENFNYPFLAKNIKEF